MSIKSKIISAIANHPKLVTLCIGLTITFGISLAVCIVSPHQALAGDEV